MKRIAAVLVSLLLTGCSGPSKFEKLVGVEEPLVSSREESGVRFHREYYVYNKTSKDGASNFDSICAKLSGKYDTDSGFNPGSVKFELGKFGHPPGPPKGFEEQYSANITRHYCLESRDRMHVIHVYESSQHVCVLLADGS
ncbi:hypothetical protein OKA04_08815 [Luteolibacter flavescens]|uniref:Lipoprotein n=1 Tax=Luteolibacter flavescens TaxID=1859460 RepID=A0ABT3FMZ1_9BACT|nr:hypothetical protein [Luteolibacter flavescens]MCW1884827.1 hypothetical protein [Luteolibacter flavescens]